MSTWRSCSKQQGCYLRERHHLCDLEHPPGRESTPIPSLSHRRNTVCMETRSRASGARVGSAHGVLNLLVGLHEQLMQRSSRRLSSTLGNRATCATCLPRVGAKRMRVTKTTGKTKMTMCLSPEVSGSLLDCLLLTRSPSMDVAHLSSLLLLHLRPLGVPSLVGGTLARDP